MPDMNIADTKRDSKSNHNKAKKEDTAKKDVGIWVSTEVSGGETQERRLRSLRKQESLST